MEERNMINVIDSPCGTGKTEWAIRYMNENNDRTRFLYVTPYLTEIDRIIRSTEFDMVTPKEGSKKRNLVSLMEQGKHIAISHALLGGSSKDLAELIEFMGYELILDEVMTVLSPMLLGQGDIKLLLEQELIAVNDDGSVRVTEKGWEYNQNKIKYSGEFEIIDTGNVLMLQDCMMVWEFPINILSSFRKIHILTYMFDGQPMCNYLLAGGKGFNYYSVENFELKEGVNRPYSGEEYKDLINIYDGKLNSVGLDKNSLSSTWYMDKTKYRLRTVLSKAVVNYFKNIAKANSGDSLWTCKINANGDPSITVYNYVKAFVPMTSRATNIYRDRSNCAYLANRFENPIVYNYFVNHGIDIDNNLFALSELVQWLFRSAIRDRKPINLYIPSSRMRGLLKAWLDGKTDKANEYIEKEMNSTSRMARRS